VSVDSIRAAVTALMPELRTDLESLVRIPSCAFPGFPREPVHQAAERTSQLFVDAGLSAELLPIEDGEPAVVARGGAGAKRVLLYAHYDVQPAGDLSAWHTDPFVPVEKHGRLYGRGAADDKSGIVMHVGAVKALRAALGSVPVEVVALIEGEEECGGPLPDYVLHHPEAVQADAIVIGDVGNRTVGEPTFVTALRGLVDCQVEVRTLPRPAHSGAPADEAEFREELGMSADQPLLGTGPLADRLVSRPAVSVIGLDAPPVEGAINAVVPYARAKVSMRIPPGTDTQGAMNALCDHLRAAAPWGVDVVVTPGEQGRGCAIATDGPAYAAARWAMETAFGKPAAESGEGGSIPLVAALQEVVPQAEVLLIGAEDPGALIHAPNESVDLKELENMVLAEALFLARLGGAV